MVPHVRTAVAAACGDDPTAISEVLAALSPEQRSGMRCLPDPLPEVPAISAHGVRAMPDGADRDGVLALALCGEGPVQVLCAIAGYDADRVILSPLARAVEFGAGRFRFADPMLRAWSIGEATEPRRLAAHRRLASVLAAAGEENAALWHRARGAAFRDPTLAEQLLQQANAATRIGDARDAYDLAVEAGEHTRPGTVLHEESLLAAGRAALSGGWAADARDRITPLLSTENRAEATPAFLLAHTLLHGMVPDPSSLVPTGSSAAVGGYRRATMLGAVLSAERGDHERSTAWLGCMKRTVPSPEARASVVGWCRMLLGEGEALAELGRDREAPVPVDAAATPAPGALVSCALSLGLGGDPDAGVRALAAPEATAGEDPLLGLPLACPMLRARATVAEALLHVWAGRIGVAHQLLRTAAADLPIALPLAGLGVTLSRRLDLAVDGGISPLTHGLSVGTPWTREPDGFVDRAIRAYLQGRSDETAVHLGLWADRGAPAESFGLPGLDEIGPIGATPTLEPPDAAVARALRVRIRSVREASWHTELGAVAEQSRTVRSPFERARVEALLGSWYAIRGDHDAALRHLRAARSMFDESGALAWRGMVERRLRRFGTEGRSTRRVPAAPSAEVPSPFVPAPLSVCRAAWQPILTTRELAVALLMAEGRANRDIAEALHVSVRTVEVHAGRIFGKLDVRTRTELSVLAHRTDQHL